MKYTEEALCRKGSHAVKKVCTELFHCDVPLEGCKLWHHVPTVLQCWGPNEENLVNMGTCFAPLPSAPFGNPSDLDENPVVISVAVLSSVLCVQLPINAWRDLSCICAYDDPRLHKNLTGLIGLFKNILSSLHFLGWNGKEDPQMQVIHILRYSLVIVSFSADWSRLTLEIFQVVKLFPIGINVLFIH